MKKKVVVIGLGMFGREVAVSLTRRGYAVLAVDQKPDVVDDIKDDVDDAIVLDSTDERALQEAKIDEMAIAVCTIGSEHLEDSILTTALLHQLGVPRIISRAATDLHARILRQVGATEITNPEKEMGWRLAYQIATPGIREILRLAEDVCVAEIPVPTSFAGQTLVSLDVRRRYNVMVLGVQRLDAAHLRGQKEAGRPVPEEDALGPTAGERRRLILNVGPNEKLREDDVLVVVGNEEDIARLGGIG
jgi:trk system potassium uptake protein TrkA